MTLNFLWTLLTVFLGSSVATALIQIVFQHRRDQRQRDDSAEYLALELAFRFEGYAMECAEKASNHRLAVSSGGHAGGLIGHVPEAPAFPESDAFKLLDRDILNDVIEFPQRCRMANEDAMFWWNVVGDDDAAQNAALKNSLVMGGRALDVARALRSAHKLKLRDMSFGQWDIQKFFAKELEQVTKATEQERKPRTRRSRRKLSGQTEAQDTPSDTD